VANFGFNWIWGILFVFAVRTLGLHAALIGALLALGEVGGLLGATVGNRFARAAGIGPTMIVAAVVSAPAVLAVALTPRAMPIPLFAIGWMVGSFTRVVFNVIGTSIRQAVVPQQLQGRVVGFNRFIAWGVIPLGSLSGGAVATNIGLRAAMIIGAIIASCWAVPVLFSPLRSLQKLPATRDDGGEPEDSLRRADAAT
jgi:MFS family permease